MSHRIRAYIAKFDDLKSVGKNPVPLPQGLGIIGVWKADSLKWLFPHIYIQTDYFGGVGGQGAAYYDKGIEKFSLIQDDEGRPYAAHPINDALKMLGVMADKKNGIDEFDAIRLGDFRDNEDFDMGALDDRFEVDGCLGDECYREVN